MKRSPVLLFILSLSLIGVSCKRNPVNDTGTNTKLKYSDTVFYLKGSDYTVSPLNGKSGTYTAYPDNLKINNTTGAITVTLKGNDGESQTGLRYKIKFTSGSEVDSTYITIAGINYFDKFYDLSQNDSIIRPVYNGDFTKAIPSGSYNLSGNNKLAINPSNGEINIKETIRRGFFDDQLHGSWKQITLKYTINDGSAATNSMDIILYYYNTQNEVPSNVSALMQAHQRMAAVSMNAPIVPSTPGPIDNNLSSDLSLFKPRPPCIVIVGH